MKSAWARPAARSSTRPRRRPDRRRDGRLALAPLRGRREPRLLRPSRIAVDSRRSPRSPPERSGRREPASDNRAAKAALSWHLHGLSSGERLQRSRVLQGQKEHLLLGLRVDELGFLGIDHGVQLAEIVRVVGRGRR